MEVQQAEPGVQFVSLPSSLSLQMAAPKLAEEANGAPSATAGQEKIRKIRKNKVVLCFSRMLVGFAMFFVARARARCAVRGVKRMP